MNKLLAVLVLVPSITLAQAVSSEARPVVTTIKSTAPSGTNGFACTVNGCQVDLGTGASDHFLSDGTGISTPGTFIANGFYMTSGAIFASNQMRLATSVALPSCASGIEGAIFRQTGTGGTNSGAQTRFCVCVSDGAASPTYLYRNLISGTAGNSTTCNP